MNVFQSCYGLSVQTDSMKPRDDGVDDEDYVDLGSPANDSLANMLKDVTAPHKGTNKSVISPSSTYVSATDGKGSVVAAAASSSQAKATPTTVAAMHTQHQQEHQQQQIQQQQSASVAGGAPAVPPATSVIVDTSVARTKSVKNISKVRSDISMFSDDSSAAGDGADSALLLSPPTVFKQKIMKRIEEKKHELAASQHSVRDGNLSPLSGNPSTVFPDADGIEHIPEESIFKNNRYAYYEHDHGNFITNLFGFGSKKHDPKLKPIGFNKKRYLKKKEAEAAAAAAAAAEREAAIAAGGIPAIISMASMFSQKVASHFVGSKEYDEPVSPTNNGKKADQDTVVSQLSNDDQTGTQYVRYEDNPKKSASASIFNVSNHSKNKNKLSRKADEILINRSIDSSDTGTTKYYNDHGIPMIPSKVPSGRCWKLRSCLSSTGFIYFIIFLATVAGLFYGVVEKLHFIQNPFRVNWDTELSVAFVGNAYFYVNDIPRLMEAISSGHIYQQSCIHAGGSLSDLWMTGNGMYKLWRTNDAILKVKYDPSTNTTSSNDEDNNGGNYVSVYDYGICTVAQIIQGYDEYIAYGNPSGQYYNDGLNPCIVDPYYATFVESQKDHILPSSWDYIVLADQTKRMAIPEARNVSVEVLLEGYGPLIAAASGSAIPVIVDTHAFWSDGSNMTGLEDVPTFTSLIYDGIADYIDALKQVLPRKKYPIVAPIGLAYLTVWEENYDLWESLFIDDKIHPSIRGSYLFGCVLYTTLFGHLPDPAIVKEPESIQYLFEGSRKLLGNSNGGSGSSTTYLTADEIEYLLNVARRVALRGYVPRSFYNHNRLRRLVTEHHVDRIANHQQRRQLQHERRQRR